MSKRKTRKAHRSAITGEWVMEKYAKKHPKTTVRVTVVITPPKKRKKK